MTRKSPMILTLALLLVVMTTAAFAKTTPAAAPTGVVNINTADVHQLMLLPQVGAKAAQRIVDYRQAHGAFQKTTDLMQVKGFGNKKYQTLSPYLTVDGKTTLTGQVSIPRGPRKSSAKAPATQASK